MKTFKDYYEIHQISFESFKAIGYNSIKVLPELYGKPWDDYALGLLHALRPSCIRVTFDMVTCDSITWRVTVSINEDNLIREIKQEVLVGLPKGVEHGHAL